jgi:hypothetical protein
MVYGNLLSPNRGLQRLVERQLGQCQQSQHCGHDKKSP